MGDSVMPKGLRWFLFVIGVGALIASGIYLGTAIGDGAVGWRLLRAVMFLLLGVFFVLMYGEHTSGGDADSNKER